MLSLAQNGLVFFHDCSGRKLCCGSKLAETIPLPSEQQELSFLLRHVALCSAHNGRSEFSNSIFEIFNFTLNWTIKWVCLQH